LFESVSTRAINERTILTGREKKGRQTPLQLLNRNALTSPYRRSPGLTNKEKNRRRLIKRGGLPGSSLRFRENDLEGIPEIKGIRIEGEAGKGGGGQRISHTLREKRISIIPRRALLLRTDGDRQPKRVEEEEDGRRGVRGNLARQKRF